MRIKIKEFVNVMITTLTRILKEPNSSFIISLELEVQAYAIY